MIEPYAAHPATGRLLLGDFRDNVNWNPPQIAGGGSILAGGQAVGVFLLVG